MRFAEIDVLGVYVAPISLLMLGAWAFTMGFTRLAARLGLLKYAWHPALVVFDIYVVTLSAMVLLVAR